MRETQENIKKYKEQLTHVKSKIAAAGLFFVMSIAMLTTASFAWIVLSTSPEVSKISTTIAGNGNLEITLANSDEYGNLLYPLESTAKDGTKDILERNITWGNLINLGNSAYGLHRITLNPAAINTSNLLEYPLLAMKYLPDGRVQLLNNDGLVYSNFDSTANGNVGSFIVKDKSKFGVRAVSATKNENLGSNAIKNRIEEIKNTEIANLKKAYQNVLDMKVTSSQDNSQIAAIDEVVIVMGKYMNTILNGESTENFKANLPNIILLMSKFNDVLMDTLDVYSIIINEQASIVGLTETYTGEDILEKGANYFLDIESNGKKIEGLDGMSDIIRMYKKIETNIKTLESKKTSDTVYWSAIKAPINDLVEINTCYLYGDPKKNLTFYTDYSNAIGLLGKRVDVTIKNGFLKEFEQITESSMTVTDKKISVKKGITISVEVNSVSTEAKAPFKINTNLEELLIAMNNGVKPTKVAAETYGMVIDFWLRTNADKTQVVLEGKPIVEQQVQTFVENDIEYDCYVSDNKTVYYFKPNNGNSRYEGERDLTGEISSEERKFLMNGNFYNRETGQQREFAEGEKENFVNNIITTWSIKKTVTGYDTTNRVWEESEYLTEEGTSVTQGQGSCYIFYPNSTIERDQMLRVLKALRVAFINENGKIIGNAYLNTEEAYDNSGKVIVPLELDSTNTIEINDEDVNYLIELEKGNAKLVSALVFLEGKNITNDLVNAVKGVSGHLNLQFGSTVNLNPKYDNELANKIISITGGLGNSYSDLVEMTFGDSPTLSTDVRVNIDGVNASNVHVNFIRQVNNNQGITLENIPLTKVNGEWQGKAIFTSPGEYVLRSVWIDGVEYQFNENKVLKVNISGLAINNVWLGSSDENIYHMSVDKTYSVNAYVSLAANAAYKPTSVIGLFRKDTGGFEIVNFTKTGSDIWEGIATFNKSGTFVLDTLIINDEEYGLPKGMQRTVTTNLGVSANVKLSSTSAIYEGKAATVEVETEVFDNSGNLIKDLTNVYLMYKSEGSNLNPGYAILKWDSNKQKYVGNIRFAMAGLYKFYSLGINKTVVDVGEDDNVLEMTFTNTITKANADTFSFIPMDAPEYATNYIDEYQFAPNDDAIFSIEMKNTMAAQGAAEVAYITMENGKEVEKKYIVYNTVNNDTNVVKKDGAEENSTIWNFKLPSRGEASQNGKWKLNAIYLTGVYIEDDNGVGKIYSLGANKTWEDADAGYYRIDLSKENLVTEVVNDLTIRVTNNKNGEFAKTIFTNTLGGEYNRSNYQIVIKDYFEKDIKDNSISIDSVNLSYQYDFDENSLWVEGETTAGASYVSTLNVNLTNNNNTYSSKDTIKFLYPGQYDSKLAITIVDKDDPDSTKHKSYSYTVSMDSGTPTITADGNVSVSIKVLSMIGNETVTWHNPDMIFQGVDHAVNSSSGTTSTKEDKFVYLGYRTQQEESSGCGGSSTKTYYYYDKLTVEVIFVGDYTSVEVPLDQNNFEEGCMSNQDFGSIKEFNANNRATYEFPRMDGVISQGYTTASSIKIKNNYGTFNFTFDEINEIYYRGSSDTPN